MKTLFTVFVLILLYACGNSGRIENTVIDTTNYLHDIAPFTSDSYEMLSKNYPGVTDIITLWLLHYKGPNKVKILSVNDETDAVQYLKAAHIDYIELLDTSVKTGQNLIR